MTRHTYTPNQEYRWEPSPVNITLGLLAPIAGIAAAIYSYGRNPSWMLAIFVFAMVSYALGQGLRDVIVKPHKLLHAAYAALLPVISTAVLYGAYRLWGSMTSAVIAGFVVGGIMQPLLGWLLLRDVVDDQTGLSAAGVARTLGTMIRSMVRTEGGFKLVTEQPTTLAELKDRYAIAKGSLEVNLEQLALPVGTTHVQAHVDAGALTVVVPRGVAVQAHEEAGDGTLGIFDRTVTGTNVRQDFTDEDYSQAALRLALDLSVGSGVLNVVRTG